ncbi:Proliferating cell nuclear antigen 2 [Striga hermonthica]|uniref:DNA sliding clamp PCNA n=1 Tax=Striga hermonthica TaxID=68872 RepID=A0A9N7MMK9_STRHE|nr:Proliferating cell nuclear antigen 2 [Striga hermonthica]
MFELRLVEGGLLKKILESVKDLVNDANFDCSSTGFSLQAMDSSHVALVSFLLRAEAFDHYRCDRSLTMGMNLANMAKMLRCAAGDDIITIKADDGTDTVTFMFENPSQDKISDFEMKLMDIDSEHLGIPDTEYEAIVRMPSAEYSRICRDFSSIGDTVVISVTKEGVKFSTRGDIGTANIVCRQNTTVDNPEDATVIEMEKPVTQTFALRYMNAFAKAAPVSSQVTISLSSELPIVVEYKISEVGYLRFYLAPKIEEEDEEMNGGVQIRTSEPKAELKKKPKMETEQPKVEMMSEVEPIPILVDEAECVEEIKPKIETNGGEDVFMDAKLEQEANGEAEAYGKAEEVMDE